MGLKKVKIPMGLLISVFAPITAEPANAHPTYGPAVDMGAAVKAYLTITTANGSIYGDDEELLYDENFVSAQVDSETTWDDLETNAVLFGHTYANGVETSNKQDRSPYGGYGFVRHLKLKSGAHVYRAVWLYRTKPMNSSEKDEADTQKEGFDPKMNTFSLKVNTDNLGDWRDRAEFGSLAEAEAWIAAKHGGGTAKRVYVSVFGDGTVTPEAVMAASGTNVELSFSDTPAAFYDNGVDKLASISSKKYTISSIAGDHECVAIFS